METWELLVFDNLQVNVIKMLHYMHLLTVLSWSEYKHVLGSDVVATSIEIRSLDFMHDILCELFENVIITKSGKKARDRFDARY